jgi:hypothetical protein
MKPDGQLLLTLPFAFPEHEMPNDYRRLTVIGIQQVLKECGFEIISIEKLGTSFETLIQLIMIYLSRLLYIKKLYSMRINFIIQAIFLAPLCLIGIVGGKLFRKHQSLYLDICVLAKKLAL